MTRDEIKEKYGKIYDCTRFIEYVTRYRDFDEEYEIKESSDKLSIYYKHTLVAVAYKIDQENIISNKETVKEFIPQDTKGVQIQSVSAFMEVFGYLMGVNGSFENHNRKPYFKGCETISFRTAVMLHNFENIDWHGDNFSEPFSTDKYTFNKARASKIVEKAFLQATRHGSILCHKHLVKFTDPAYQYIFLEYSK